MVFFLLVGAGILLFNLFNGTTPQRKKTGNKSLICVAAELIIHDRFFFQAKGTDSSRAKVKFEYGCSA